MEHGVNADPRGDAMGIHGIMTAVAATARQHHGANTDIPAVLLPQTIADSPTVYIIIRQPFAIDLHYKLLDYYCHWLL